jgi:tRNA G18 (ribose-2'-O)-methylase SpoU
MRQLRKKEAKQFFRQQVQKREYELHLLLENIQYARNVASIFRTADAAGVHKIHLTGISKQPPFGKDLVKASRHKERSLPWDYSETSIPVITRLKQQGFVVIAIEITDNAQPLAGLPQLVEARDKVCLVAGSEVYGVINKTLVECDASIFIPMYGKGASLNVAASVAVALYGLP